MIRHLQQMTLHAMVSWLAIGVILVFFLTITLGSSWWLAQANLRELRLRAQSIARTLATEAVDPVLLEDPYAAFDVLNRAMEADPEIRYAFIMLREHRVIAHTFEGGFPRQLLRYCIAGHEPLLEYRTKDDYIMDFSVPLLEGELGHLHLGISERRVLMHQRYFSIIMLVVLVLLLGVALLAARLIAWLIGQPLLELSHAARQVPTGNLKPDDVPESGSAEVRELSQAFRQMIGDLRHLKAENLSTQKRLVAAERLATLGELSAGLAHEILNPLDGILECSRQLERHVPKETRQGRYLQLIQEGLYRIERVMRQMLVFARSPQQSSELSPHSVDELVNDVIELTRPRLQRYGITLDSGEMTVDARCYCHRHPIEQALLNLILNAADACAGSEQPTIHLWATLREEWVDIHIEDSGPGVPAEDLERIFRPFYTTKDPDKGTGLGLTVSRDLVEQSGGELILENDSRKLSGAHFRTSLRRYRPAT